MLARQTGRLGGNSQWDRNDVHSLSRRMLVTLFTVIMIDMHDKANYTITVLIMAVSSSF
jgi:hypothetical protein